MINTNNDSINDIDLSVIVSVKASSLRVHNKNWKVFYKGKSLLEIKLLQLLNIIPKEKIFLYSDTEKAIEVGAQYGIDGFIKQDMFKETNWPAIIEKVTSKINSKYLLRVCVTTPFIGSITIMQIIREFIFHEKEYDSIVAVEKLQTHLLDSRGKPINFGPSSEHKLSQELEPVYSLKAGVYMLSLETAKRVKYHFGENPYLFVLPELEAIDINTNEDWEIAQLILTSAVIKKYIQWDFK